jgi:4-hydroxy-L-threonine phosphate dehydrogenase PdxA
MIEERFLESAINIRRTYLKLTGDLNMYQKRAEQIVEVLEKSIKRLEDLQQEIKDTKAGKSNISNEKAINEVLSTINEVEQEGERLNLLFEPINKEIEKLAKEESELWNKIIEKHSDITEDKIIEIFKTRLNREGLV